MLNVDDSSRSGLMLLLVILIGVQVNLTDQFGQKPSIMRNESTKTNEYEDNRTTHLHTYMIPMTGHTSWNNRKLINKYPILNLTLATSTTSSSSQLSSLALRDQQIYNFDHNNVNRKHHKQWRIRNPHRYIRYRHGHKYQVIKLLSRRKWYSSSVSSYHMEKKRNLKESFDRYRHRRSSAERQVVTTSFPSHVTIDSPETITKSNLLDGNYLKDIKHYDDIEISDKYRRDNSHVIPTHINSMRIMRRDTDSLELRTIENFQVSNLTWPLKRVAEIEGDLMIGGLHMVHERENKRICGPVMPQGGLQAAEVMLYTVDKINEFQVIPGGLKLGAHILDDCDTDTYGLQQAVDFIKGKTYILNYFAILELSLLYNDTSKSKYYI